MESVQLHLFLCAWYSVHVPPPLPFCSKGQSVPKEFLIILSTLPSWWHQIVASKESLVHPHPETYTHRKENKEHCFTGLYVHLPVCNFVCTSIYAVMWERKWLHYFAVVTRLHDDWELNNNQNLFCDKWTDKMQWKCAPEHIGNGADWDLVQVSLTDLRSLSKLTVCRKGIMISQYCPECPRRRFPANVTHTGWEKCDIHQ